MKSNYIFIVLILVATTILVSCRDDEKVRFDPDDLQTGVNFRVQIDPDYQFFDLGDITNASVRWDVFTTSSDITEGRMYLTYYSFEQDSTYAEVLARSYTMSDFDSEGAIRGEILTTQDLVQLVGVENGIDGVAGADRIDFRMEVEVDDGRIFPATVPGTTAGNVSTNILNASATTSLTTSLTAFVACPIPDAQNFAVGDYSFSYDADAGTFPFGVYYFHYPASDPADTVVTLEFENTITRKFSVGHLQEFVPDFEAELSFLLICDNVIVPLQGGGLACGGTSLNFQTADDMPGSYDATDDSRLVLRMEDNGGCGVVGFDFNFILDKVVE